MPSGCSRRACRFPRCCPWHRRRCRTHRPCWCRSRSPWRSRWCRRTARHRVEPAGVSSESRASSTRLRLSRPASTPTPAAMARKVPGRWRAKLRASSSRLPGSRWSSQVAASPARRATSSTRPTAMPSWSAAPAIEPSWSASSRRLPATRVCCVAAWSVRSRRVCPHSCRTWSFASRVTCLASWPAVAATSPAACLVSCPTVPARSAGVCGVVVWVSMSTPSSRQAVVDRRRVRGVPGASGGETLSGAPKDDLSGG